MTSSDWRPARSLTVLQTQVNARFPYRSTASDGMYRSIAHHIANPTSDHEPRLIGYDWVVCAFDITAEPWMQALVDALVASRDRRIKYLIWQRKILDSRIQFNPWKWVPYAGTDAHVSHLHISVLANDCDDMQEWSIGKEPEMTPQEMETLANLTADKVYNRYVEHIDDKNRNLTQTLEKISGDVNTIQVKLGIPPNTT